MPVTAILAFYVARRLAAVLSSAFRSSDRHLYVECEASQHILNADVAKKGNFEDEKRLSAFVNNDAGAVIVDNGERFEWRREEVVGELMGSVFTKLVMLLF